MGVLIITYGFGQRLEGHLALEVRIFRQVNLTHADRAELADLYELESRAANLPFSSR